MRSKKSNKSSSKSSVNKSKKKKTIYYKKTNKLYKRKFKKIKKTKKIKKIKKIINKNKKKMIGGVKGKQEYNYICNPNIITDNVKDLCVKSKQNDKYKTLEECAFSNECIENFQKKKKINEPINFSKINYEPQTHNLSGVLICMLCNNSILDKKHREHCVTVNMYQKIEIKLSEFTKPMMTFGLAGCTAIIIKTTDSIIMAHHPEQQQIFRWITDANINSNIEKLYIKIPHEYEKTHEGKWTAKSTTMFDDIEVNKIIESYTVGSNNIYDSTLYCKMIDNNINYTNYIGTWSIL